MNLEERPLTLEEKIVNFVSEKSPKLYILTPCYGSLCYVNYVRCIMATKEVLDKFKIPLEIEFCRNDSLVSRARNNLVAKAMNDEKCTHIMFIDSDITWNPLDILKLLLTDKCLCGGVYPLKHYYWEKLSKGDNVVKTWINKKNDSQFNETISDESAIQHNLLKYNINYIDNVLNIEANLAKVKHLATGFMMFKREVIEKMSKSFPHTKYVDDVGFLSGTENDNAYALFDCGVEDGHYFSEDWMFCHRWSQMGGNIYVHVGINLVHTGTEDFNGSYVSSIM
jgi:hypothetical protein